MIGVLICDHVEERHREAAGGDYDKLFEAALRAVDPKVALRFYDVIGGELPESPNECDGWIITGSRHSAYDPLDWIDRLSKFIQTAHSQGSRMVGVCFGHQIIASALGGRVEKAPSWTIGVQDLELDEQVWFPGGKISLLAMHQDVVTELPKGGRVIGSGAATKIPAYVLGDTVLGIQYHPEFTADFERAIILERVEMIGSQQCATGLKSLARETHAKKMSQWILSFLKDSRATRESG